MAAVTLIVSADDHTAAGGVADDALTLPADDVGIRCRRVKRKYQAGLHNKHVVCKGGS